MKTPMKTLIAASAAIAVPAIALAAPSFSGFGGFGFGADDSSVRPGMGMFRNAGGSGATVPTKIREALAASGVTLPSDADISSAHATMRSVAEARRNFEETDADRAALKAIREEAAKKEREYLRSRGVALPNEEEIAKAAATHARMSEAMQTVGPKMGKRGMRGGQHGGMRGNSEGFGGWEGGGMGGGFRHR